MTPSRRPTATIPRRSDPALVVLVLLVVVSFGGGVAVGVLAGSRRAPVPVRLECLCARAGAP